jgi:hypothetical protein
MTTIPKHYRIAKPVTNPIEDREWTKNRSCATSHPDEDWWYPESGTTIGEAREQSQMAIKICQGCPVRDYCLTTALANNEQHGIWGGRDFGREPACALCDGVLRHYNTGVNPNQIPTILGHPATRLAACLTRHGNHTIAEDLGWTGKKTAA